MKADPNPNLIFINNPELNLENTVAKYSPNDDPTHRLWSAHEQICTPITLRDKLISIKPTQYWKRER